MENETLFTGDEAYERQEAEISRVQEIGTAMAFIKYKILDSCENCKWRDVDGKCHVMEKYKVPPFDTVTLGKCNQFKKNI